MSHWQWTRLAQEPSQMRTLVIPATRHITKTNDHEILPFYDTEHNSRNTRDKNAEGKPIRAEKGDLRNYNCA